MNEPLLELVIDSPSVARVRLAGGEWETVRIFRVELHTPDAFYVLQLGAPRIPTPWPAVITTAANAGNGDGSRITPGGTAAEGGVVDTTAGDEADVRTARRNGNRGHRQG